MFILNIIILSMSAPISKYAPTAGSDRIVKVAFWVGVSVVVLTISLMFWIITMRLLLVLNDKRRAKFLAGWRPLLMQCVMSVPDKFPRVSRENMFAFLSLWNYFHESLKGQAKGNLNKLGYLVGIDHAAVKLISKRNLLKRLTGIATLGHLGERKGWIGLLRVARSNNTLLSLTAVRALVHIDAKNAVPLLMKSISERADWPIPIVASILREAGPEAVSKPIMEAILENADKSMIINGSTKVDTNAIENLRRLISLIEVTDYTITMPAIRAVIETHQDDRIISACLEILNGPEDLEFVRKYINYPRWHVRVKAATTLGKIGVQGDEERLIELLSDKEWWVRYRAAEALANLPFIKLEGLKQIQERQTDRYARDIIKQVISEKSVKW